MFKPKRRPDNAENYGWWGLPAILANREARVYALLLGAVAMEDFV